MGVSRFSLVLGILIMAGSSMWWAQAIQTAAPGRVLVELSPASGAPGKEVALPLELTVWEDLKLGKIEVEVRLQKNSFELVGVEAGSAAEQAEIVVEHRLGEEKERHSSVRIKIETSDGGFLESGELARLTIRIREEALEQSVILPTTAKAWSSGSPPAQLEGVTSLNGIVAVIAETQESIFACFFYMH